jgi:hypothetical protein
MEATARIFENRITQTRFAPYTISISKNKEGLLKVGASLCCDI